MYTEWSGFIYVFRNINVCTYVNMHAATICEKGDWIWGRAMRLYHNV